MPTIFAGMRTGLSLAVIMMVISESFAATKRRLFDLVGATVRHVGRPLGVLGILLNTILLLVEARLLAWHRDSRAAAARK